MSKIILLILILLIILGYGMVTYLPMGGSTTEAVNTSDIKKDDVSSSPISETPQYNPPPEIKYDSATDLNAELESVDPKVLEEDFREFDNLN